MRSMAGVVLSIDFGTSNTAAAFRDRDGRLHELRLSTTGSLMPSAVFLQDGRILVGRTAAQAAFTAPEAFEPTPKRRLADREIFLAGAMVAVTDLVAAVLAEVLVRARQVMGATPDEVVLTHPDQWATPLQQLLVEAAATAGIDPTTIRLVSESQAAAWFYAHEAPDAAVGSRLVVFDFGAGTCDVAVLDKQRDGSFVVIAADGIEGLGGHDLDARIHGWVRKQLAVTRPVLLSEVNNAAAVATRLTLNDRIRDAKEALSEASSAAIVVAGTADNQVLQLTRDEFNQLIDADIARAVELTRRVMNAAESRRHSPFAPTIYLTGGSSHIPLVHARLAELGALGILGDPKTVVVQGALLTPSLRPSSLAHHTPTHPPASTPSGPHESGIRAKVRPALRQQPDDGKWLPNGHKQRRSGRSRKRRIVLSAAAMAGVVAAVAGVLVGVRLWDNSGDVPTPTPPGPTTTTPESSAGSGTAIPAEGLSTVLLSTQELERIMSTAPAVFEVRRGEENSDRMRGTDDSSSDDKCFLGVLRAAEPLYYPDFDKVSYQSLRDTVEQHWVEQAVVSFDSVEASRAFFTDATDRWKECSTARITVTGTESGPSPTVTTGASNESIWRFGSFSASDSTLTLMAVDASARGWMCQRALMTVSNMILDVSACSLNPSGDAEQIVEEMSKRVTG